MNDRIPENDDADGGDVAYRVASLKEARKKLQERIKVLDRRGSFKNPGTPKYQAVRSVGNKRR